jgi:hypothetical protein
METAAVLMIASQPIAPVQQSGMMDTVAVAAGIRITSAHSTFYNVVSE